MGLLVGHTWLREQSGAGSKYDPVSPEVYARMLELGKENLDAGCVGVSFGVKYIPGTTEEEIAGVAKLSVARDLLVTSHVRNDVSRVFDAVREMADIGRALGVRVQISHIGSMGGYGQMEKLLLQMEGYRSDGIDILADCYPYEAFSTWLGGTTYDEENFLEYRSGYDSILICSGPYAGQRCTQELFHKLRREAPDTLTVGYFMRSEDIDMALASPLVMLGSDGIRSGNQGHPRAAGAFARFIAKYIKEGKVPMMEGIAKMTAMPAERLRFTKKGSLSPGADADVTIFDLDTIEDKATYEEPTLPPVGIEAVIIGGKFALKNGQVVDSHLGRSTRV
jgi:N-acyl-D-amino-acid deacylase